MDNATKLTNTLWKGGIKMRNKRSVTLIAFAVVLIALLYIPAPAQKLASPDDLCVRPGRCATASEYYVGEGYLPIPDRVRWIGVLKGSWYEMGVEYGKRAGDLVRWATDEYWQEQVNKEGLNQLLIDIHKYEKEDAYLLPQMLEMMKGIADGAAPYLAKSPYAGQSTFYEKVLLANIMYDIKWDYPTGSGCSSFAAKNAHGQTIVTHNWDDPFWPIMYSVAFVAVPNDRRANTYWTLTTAGKVGGLMAVNNKGLSFHLTAGGNAVLTDYAFGVNYFPLISFISAYADNADEAVKILTLGTAEYRAKTGRATLLKTGHWGWMAVDSSKMVTVESTAHRYATRNPGDYGETGQWMVLTNHMLINTGSYNANNVWEQGVPMTTYSDEAHCPSSASRYWTHFWNLKRTHTCLTVNDAFDYQTAHYWIDKAGLRHDDVWSEALKIWMPAYLSPYDDKGNGLTTVCQHSKKYPNHDIYGSTSGTKVAVLPTLDIYWRHGRGCNWEGAWDHINLRDKHTWTMDGD